MVGRPVPGRHILSGQKIVPTFVDLGFERFTETFRSLRFKKVFQNLIFVRIQAGVPYRSSLIFFPRRVHHFGYLSPFKIKDVAPIQNWTLYF